MVKLPDRRRTSYYGYLEKQRRYEMIDSAILENFNGHYELLGDDIPLHTTRGSTKKDTFSTDLLYLSNDNCTILMVEETLDITSKNKKDQLDAYCNISVESLQLISKTDIVPTLDIFIVFPITQRDESLAIYNEIEKEKGIDGKKRGISLWCYPTNKKFIKCVGGVFSDGYPGNRSSL